MTRIEIVSVALSLVLAGCPATNVPPLDAAGVDALTEADAWSADAAMRDAGSDAFVCPDLDLDGETDATCGGTDCDDTDPALSSRLGPCGTATAIRRCVGGVVADVACTGETPYCDARLGECVADACGDGVLHDNEVCEEGDELCHACRRWCYLGQPCSEDESCVPVVDQAGREAGVCTPAAADGAADGARCERDEECRSAYCEGMMRRCTSVAEPEDCNRGGSSVGSDLLYTVAGDARLPELCIYSCFHQSECGEGALCRIAVVFHPPLRTVMAACEAPGAIGTAAFGDACVRDADCQSLMCVGGRCTVVCRDETDCGGVLPACVGVDLSAERFVTARPDDWPTPWPLLCAPAP